MDIHGYIHGYMDISMCGYET